MSEQQQLKKREGRQRLLAVALVGLVAAMVGLAFASVPLYRLFCQATGYGGVPQRADRGADKVLDRTIRIRFDANVDGALPWSFVPDQRFIDVKIGETALAFFKATNNSSQPVTGQAIFNVAPELAGRYFTKIECFCFKQQTLAAHASVEMPVTFFVDPKIVDDQDTKTIDEITLSYTFYRADKGPGVAAAPPAGNSGS
jgi:cytochrome c oxidase assembly protein subunit 11